MPIKNAVEFAQGKHRGLYALSYCVTKVRQISNLLILINYSIAYFIGTLILIGIVIPIKNAVEFAQGKHRGLYALSYCVTKVRQISNLLILINYSIAYFIGTLILIGVVTPIKNAVEFAQGKLAHIVCRFSLCCETADIHQPQTFKKVLRLMNV